VPESTSDGFINPLRSNTAALNGCASTSPIRINASDTHPSGEGGVLQDTRPSSVHPNPEVLRDGECTVGELIPVVRFAFGTPDMLDLRGYQKGGPRPWLPAGIRAVDQRRRTEPAPLNAAWSLNQEDPCRGSPPVAGRCGSAQLHRLEPVRALCSGSSSRNLSTRGARGRTQHLGVRITYLAPAPRTSRRIATSPFPLLITQGGSKLRPSSTPDCMNLHRVSNHLRRRFGVTFEHRT
jgi:hypothetical protein